MECGKVFLLLTAISITFCINLPGVAPTDYEENAKVELMVEKLESSRTQLPFEFYYLNFCRPKQRKRHSGSIGAILLGTRLENSPIEIFMNINETCRALCNKKYKQKDIDKFSWMIDRDYRVNWAIDELPSAWRQTFVSEEAGGRITHYESGFPIGWAESVGNVDGNTGKAKKVYNIYNHFKIIIKVHKTYEHDDMIEDDPPTKFRIVGFQVEPYSIKHQKKEDQISPACDQEIFKKEQNILDKLMDQPIPVVGSYYQHGSNTEYPPEILAEEVSFSYGVMFEISDVPWASRWDMYLYMHGSEDQIHWFSIINSALVVLFLSGMCAHILQRTVRKDIAQYNALDLEVDDTVEESGWKQIHGDVFRSPQFPSLLCVLVGTGLQVVFMIILVLVVALLGFLSPAYRGGLLTSTLLLFVCLSGFAGYCSARLYKIFQGENWKSNALMVSLLFPGVVFAIFFSTNFLLVAERSSGAVPFITLCTILVLWFGISTPLAFLGASMGTKAGAFLLPCRVNKVPRPDKPKRWYLGAIPVMIIGGVLPFGSIFIELMFIMRSIWTQSTFYYMFGFLLLVVFILIVTSAQIAIVITYFQLCAEDHHWQWRSFYMTGASGIFLFAHSVVYLIWSLEMTRFSSIVLYLGYMFIASYTMFIFTGTVGFLSTFIFVRKIFSLIKVD